MKKLFTLSALLFAACGDDNSGRPDANVTPDGDTVDAPTDTPSWVKPTPVSVALSSTGPDQLMSVVAGPNGTFYAAGYRAAQPTSDKYLVVAKLTSAGALDTTFGGGDGYYESTLAFKGGSDEIDIAVQTTGKIVVAGTIADEAITADRDIGLFRVNADGTLDESFGPVDNGLVRVDLSTGYLDTGTSTYKALDSQRSIGIGPSNAIYIHAAVRNATTPVDDTDFAVAKLSEDGIPESTYGTGGKYQLDLQETNKQATPKMLMVLSDGSVIASGYARTAATKLNPADTDGTPQPVLYRLDPSGVPVNGFAGTDGVFHESVLSLQTEIYGFALDGDKITTAGYGRDSGTNNIWASLRFDADDGTRSTSFGGATGGVVTIDPTGNLSAGSNCRNAIGLPGGKTALIGSTGSSGSRDAVIAIIGQNGQLQTEYATGVMTFDLGTGEDQWWGAAANAGTLLAAGWKGYPSASQTDTANDDSQVVVLTLQ
jgi:uncharacterized delta-60 repeat protein